MFGALFGQSRKDPWESLPSTLRQFLSGGLLPPGSLEALKVVLEEFKPQDHCDFRSPTLMNDFEAQSHALALALVDEHGQLIARKAEEFKGEVARLLLDLSLRMNPREWNPAWAWYFLYNAKEMEEDELRKVMGYALQAYDSATSNYIRLMGRKPPMELVPLEVRMLPLYLSIEDIFASRLTDEQQDVLAAVLQREVDGATVKHGIMKHLGSDDQPSAQARELGIRVASHVVHLLGQEELRQLDFQGFQKHATCAAAMNPQHLMSRVDLALLYEDLVEADPGSGHDDSAKHYAGQALDLIREARFDLGPPHEVGAAPARLMDEVMELRERMEKILAA